MDEFFDENGLKTSDHKREGTGNIGLNNINIVSPNMARNRKEYQSTTESNGID